MSQKSKNLIFLEKFKNFQILKNPRKAQKHPKNAFHAISDHYKWFWTEKIFFRFFGSDDPISPKVPIPRYSSSWKSNSFSGILLWPIPTTYQKLSGKSWLWDEPTYLLTDALQKVALIKSQWNLITNHFDNYSCNIGVVLNCKAIKPLSRHIKHVFMRPLMRSSHKVTQKWNFNNHVFLVGMDSHPKFPNNLIEARQYRTVVGARGFILRVHFLIVMLSPIFYSWWMYQIFKKNLRIVMMIFIW